MKVGRTRDLKAVLDYENKVYDEGKTFTVNKNILATLLLKNKDELFLNKLINKMRWTFSYEIFNLNTLLKENESLVKGLCMENKMDAFNLPSLIINKNGFKDDLDKIKSKESFICVNELNKFKKTELFNFFENSLKNEDLMIVSLVVKGDYKILKVITKNKTVSYSADIENEDYDMGYFIASLKRDF